jgi:hypothetical protein
MLRVVPFLLLAGCSAGYLYITGDQPIPDDSADADTDTDADTDIDSDADGDTDTGEIPPPEDISVWQGARTYEHGDCYDVANEAGILIVEKDPRYDAMVGAMTASGRTALGFWDVTVANPSICKEYTIDGEVVRGIVLDGARAELWMLYVLSGNDWRGITLDNAGTWSGSEVDYTYTEAVGKVTWQVHGTVTFPGSRRATP